MKAKAPRKIFNMISHIPRLFFPFFRSLGTGPEARHKKIVFQLSLLICGKTWKTSWQIYESMNFSQALISAKSNNVVRRTLRWKFFVKIKALKGNWSEKFSGLFLIPPGIRNVRPQHEPASRIIRPDTISWNKTFTRSSTEFWWEKHSASCFLRRQLAVIQYLCER